MKTLQQLEETVGKGRVKENVVLAPYTTFKVGGPAQYYFQAFSDEDIVNGIVAAHKAGLKLHILGGVSNIVISEKGLTGFVIRNMYAAKTLIEDTDEHVILEIGSGYNMTKLAKETAEDGYEGFEYHFGLPGTLGGGIFMNSKWTAHPPTHYIGDNLISAKIANHSGDVRTVDHEYFQFAYDYSILQETNEIVLSAQFRMKKHDANELIQRNIEALEYRKKTQPFGVASSGCFFQNIDGKSAGKMIDELGLKGLRVGGAFVSDIHANFIVNDGTATGEDVQKLVGMIKDKVKEKHGVELKEEVVMYN